MRSLPIYGLGVVLVIMGLGLFVFSVATAKPVAPTAKKSELREQEIVRANTKKLRIAAGALVGLGALLIVLS